MSKAKENQVQRPISLPAIPKCDEQNRAKWIAEYDKIEAEYLKAHLVGNAPSAVLGLRQLPAAWDRKIPTGDLEVEDDRPRRRKQTQFGATAPPRAATTEPRAPSPPSQMLESVSRRRSRPMSASIAPNVSAPLALVQPKHTPHEILSIVFTLLNPPLRFKSKIEVDVSNIDLKWLQKFISGDRTPILHTLETIREDLLLNPSVRNEVALNSPRSVVTLFKNGASVADLQIKPLSAFSTMGTTEEVAVAAQKHHESRRQQLLTTLRTEYREMAAAVSLYDILDEVTDFRATKGQQAADVTSLKTQQEKQQHMLSLSRIAMKKALETEKEIAAKTLSAERRRDQQQQEMSERRALQRSLLSQKAVEQEKRMEELRKVTAEKNAKVQAALLARQQRVEAREAQREAALREKQEDLRMEAERRAAAKRAKMEENRKKQEEKRLEDEAKQREIERRDLERKAKAEYEASVRRKETEERQRKAAEAQHAARQKAKEHEEAIRAEAERRKEQAVRRLEEFNEQKQRERDELHRVEEEHRKMLKRAADDAQRKLQEKRDNIVRRREDHETLLSLIRDERKRAHTAMSLVQNLQQEDKLFLVERQRKALGFQKLISISHISQKEAKGDLISTQRQRLLEASRRDREQLRIDRERMHLELESRMSRPLTSLE